MIGPPGVVPDGVSGGDSGVVPGGLSGVPPGGVRNGGVSVGLLPTIGGSKGDAGGGTSGGATATRGGGVSPGMKPGTLMEKGVAGT